jgi:ankyrin repeat protein
VSSTPPAEAGVQVPLLHALLDAGAAIDGIGESSWRSPLVTALVFGFADAAEALVSRGARVDGLAAAAGLGRIADVARLLPTASPAARHQALALASQLGHADVVAALLDAGEEPNRFNPPGCHAHGTPLHHAALAGHADVVRLRVTRGARLDIRHTLWHAPPRGWAEPGGQLAVADQLRAPAASPLPSAPGAPAA